MKFFEEFGCVTSTSD